MEQLDEQSTSRKHLSRRCDSNSVTTTIAHLSAPMFTKPNSFKVLHRKTASWMIEAQWTNVNYTSPNQWLCIYGGTMASEDIRVDVRNGSTWINLFTNLVVGWNNISVSQYVSSSTFTIRFKDGTQTSDPVQSTWQIDAALLRTGISSLVSSGTSDTLVAELLQNGIIRWLGQNLQLTVQAKPIPPIPVKSIHVNQTVANVTSKCLSKSKTGPQTTQFH